MAKYPKAHWSDPYSGKTRCGRSIVYGTGLHLADREQDVTCWHCRRSLAEPWHGTHGGYSNHNCHCGPCTAANTAAMADWRARHWDTEPPEHGAAGYTNYGCRCDVCSQTHFAARRRSEAKRKARNELLH